MDRITRHLENFPLPLIGLALVVGIVVLALFPKKYALEASIVLTFAWMNINRFRNLGEIASIAKVTYWVPLLMVIVLSLFRRTPKRHVPPAAWLYLVTPILGCICVATTNDALFGMIQFGNMFVMALAALCLYRCIDSEQTLYRFILMGLLGLMVPLGISVVALFFFRYMSIIPGLGRFAPFGINPSQLVPTLALGVSFSACTVMIFKSPVVRVFCVAMIGSCLALLLATGSRQGIVACGIVLLPFVFTLARRPVALATVAVIALGAAVWTFGFTAGEVSTERLTDFSNTSGRYEIALQYLDSFAKRPFVGLMGTNDMSVIRDDTASHITHNSYLGILYTGGLLLGVPLLVVLISSVRSMWIVLLNADRCGIKPVILWGLAALLVAIYTHGLVNDMAYWGVSTWGVMHYFLSCFFMGTARDLRSLAFAPQMQYSAPQGWSYSTGH